MTLTLLSVALSWFWSRSLFRVRAPLPPGVARKAPPALVAALLACLILTAPLAPRAAMAQADDGATAAQRLDDLRQKITQIQSALKANTDLDDAALSQMKSDALAAGAAADKLATELQPQLASVQARLAELGKPVAGVKEASDVAAQRTQLDRSSSALDAQVKLAGLLSVEADQASEQVSTVRRQDLQARLGERTASIFSGQFWNHLGGERAQNVQRLAALGGEIASSARSTAPTVWAALLAALLVLAGARVWAGRYLLSITSNRVPAGRLRRSVHALVVTGLAVATPALVAELLKLGVTWDGAISDKTAAFLNSVVGTVAFGGFVIGLFHSLLAPRRPSWRLLPIPDRLALRMRRFPVVFGVILVLVWNLQLLGTLVNAGLSTAVAINGIVTLMLSLVMALALVRAERVWLHIRLGRGGADAPDPAASTPTPTPINSGAPAGNGGAAPPTTPLWVRAVVVALWLGLAVSLLSLLIGYVAFGSFIAKQLSWVLVVVSTTYLLAVLVDDICMLLASSAPDPAASNPVLPTPKARDQAAVLLSGAGRAVVVLVAIMILLAPFGEGPTELFSRVGQLHDGLSIGEIQIKPGAVIQALLVLVLGFVGLRLLKQWLANKYLPTTSLDSGMQVSAVTLFGYAGGVIAVSLALSAVGIGLERIAWVASALSVGIGFGLQAVVQNFVSGLILLAERPVKVGDWVSLGGVEGDIRRINVRATEIQMGDRSTVIVPNSEFITKTVRNITHASPLGLVQIKLPLPLDTDPEAARALILQVFVDNGDILETPAPNVQLDGIDNGYLMFNATGFSSSPRLAYGVRSNLLFELLKRLREAEMPVSKPSTMLIRDAAAVAPLLPPALPLETPSATT